MKSIIFEMNRLFGSLEEKYLSMITDHISASVYPQIAVDIKTLASTLLDLLPEAVSLESPKLSTILDCFFSHLYTPWYEICIESLDGQNPSDEQLSSILDERKQIKLREIFLMELSKDEPLMTRLIQYSANTSEPLKPITLKIFASLKMNPLISDGLVRNVINNRPKHGSAAEAIIDAHRTDLTHFLWPTNTRIKLNAAIQRVEQRSHSHYPDVFFNNSNSFSKVSSVSERNQDGYITDSDSLNDWPQMVM
ncbi:MAG: hypothetical protein CK424_01760 [Legionella sp.]|nr:MAG: hypothetical protein CK424_01760 [Legionella sp.]